MDKCSRCGRSHSGICGIPAGVTFGFGARIGGVGIGGARPQTAPGVSSRPKAAKAPDTRILDGMLAQAEGHLAKVMEQLKVLPVELPEFTALLEKEGQLNHMIKQLFGQIAAAKGAK